MMSVRGGAVNLLRRRALPALLQAMSKYSSSSGKYSGSVYNDGSLGLYGTLSTSTVPDPSSLRFVSAVISSLEVAVDAASTLAAVSTA